MRRIQKEVRFLKLLRHPNIVKVRALCSALLAVRFWAQFSFARAQVYDVLETDAEIFIVMEYASGGELFDYIVAHKRVKEKEARHFFRAIVSALDYCHSVRQSDETKSRTQEVTGLKTTALRRTR